MIILTFFSFNIFLLVTGTAVGKGDAILVMSADSVEMRDYWYHAISECIHGKIKYVINTKCLN